MQIFKNVNHWQKHRSNLEQNKTIGFIPTMGALHEGHLSLVKKSTLDNDYTVVSIFINPTQFNNDDDFKNYPISIDDDLDILKSRGVSFILLPSFNDLYKDNYNYKISENNLSLIMEGKKRPGHFDGVLTVVMKLLNIVNPQKAYFGEKDYQQLKLICGMVEAFFMKVEIIFCSTIRENDGLAFSSRNVKLSEEQRTLAPEFSKILRSKKSIEKIKTSLAKKGFQVEYVEEHDKRIYAAIQLGKVRLIDNEKL
jgi:pantoate--beta-alanine ligase